MGLLLLAAAPAGAAEDFKTPAVKALHVEWRAALDQFKSEIATRPELTGRFTFTSRLRLSPSDPRLMPAFEQLNALTSPLFSGISRSPIPVLLPLDVATYVRDQDSGATDGNAIPQYQAGFGAAEMFAAGESGYDALFALPRTVETGAAERVYAKPVEVQITGSLLVYDINDPVAGRGEAVRALQGQFPDIRRVIREGFVRYYFTAFGVPYVVSIHCLDSVPRADRLACREASSVAERFIKALRIAGGRPQRPRASRTADLAPRLAKFSSDFTYRPSGEIIPNSGYREQPGHPDWTVYSQIRFPLRDAPAFANSQSFLNWGDCFHRGRVSPPTRKGAHYHCKSNDKPLIFDESAAENYSYPWQDNFCEARDFEVGQCASGFGHQGQDIRPGSCHLRNEGADRCEPGDFPVVAVRDGVLLRSPKHAAATLVVNTRTEHIRFRYMHMDPTQLDADGVLNNRRVAEGEQLGVVGNYQDYPGGTTVHLHFDVQVFTREGWLWVNPYVTLISAYERLIDGRGREVPADGGEAKEAGTATKTE